MEILTSIVGAIGGEIAKYTLVPLGRQMGYLIFYNRNINNLREVLQKLNDVKTAVSQQVDGDRRNLIEPAPMVNTWQQKVNFIDRQATTFLEEEIMRNRKCLNDLCPNPKSRYSLSRKASKMKQTILERLGEAEKFSPTNLPAPLPSLGSTFSTKDAKDFESRNKIMEEVLEALRDDSSSMMSICGPGGVGKTTMVKKLVEVVLSEKLFDVVAMVVVSQNPNVKSIQNGIASCLGLKFDSEDEQERARKLHQRILSNHQETLLLILDDVWAEMDFEKFGIPSAGKRAGYKVLLTSRTPYECQRMGSLKDFDVGPLTKEEGWNLFKSIAFAGNPISDADDLLQLAMQIANECDGLPICIVTIAKAVKGRDKVVWSDALTQLRNSNYQGISGMDKVFSRLELSYDLLQCEDAKAIFLLCCLFPEDYAIRIEVLVRYAVGLRLLDCDETILEARNRVKALIIELRESFLLLDGREQYVRMHDALRDVAISIASKRMSYLVSCDKRMNHWPNKWRGKYNECTAISLWCEEIEEHPADLVCPKLQLLQLQSTGFLPDNFFEGMEDLKVIALDQCFPPKSLHAIKKVRTLRLSDMPSTSTFGDLEDVEILEIRKLEKFPDGVGLMKNLRLLDLRDAEDLYSIPAGVLSKLLKLEELYVNMRFMNWGKPMDIERKCASLTELESRHVTTLEIGALNISCLPKRSVLENLVNFKLILVRNNRDWRDVMTKTLRSTWRKSENDLTLMGDASEIISSGICVLLRRAKYLQLKEVENLKNDMYELGDAGFPELKTLEMSDCPEIEHVVGVKKVKDGCFGMLKRITISRCEKLEYLFLNVMARRMSRSLKSISISWCENMEGIFIGAEDGDGVEFPVLEEIHLSNVPTFKAIWMHNHQEVESNSTEKPNSILFPSSWIVTSNLKKLTLIKCDSLELVFSASVAVQLQHLQTLQIVDCEKVEYIVGGKEGNTKKELIFPMLTQVSFDNLPELVCFSVHNHIFLDWSSLEDIYVRGCPKIHSVIGSIQISSTLEKKQMLFSIPTKFEGSLKLRKLSVVDCTNLMHLFTSHVAKLLVMLEVLVIKGNSDMEQVIAKEEGEEEEKGITAIIEFPHLYLVKLQWLENMRCFYSGRCAMEFPSLDFVEVMGCKSMRTFSYGSSLLTPKLDIIRFDNENVNSIIDLNTVIREQMVTVLRLAEEWGMHISFNHLTKEEISEIRHIKIKSCEYFFHVIPCNFIAVLQKVEIIEVKGCRTMGEIFECSSKMLKGKNIQKENAPISSHLQQIILEDLNHLAHVFDIIPTTVIVFPMLKMLSIHKCNRLRTIFSVSMAMGLLQLEQLKISSCHHLEEIIEEEDEEETAATDTIVLPQLWTVDVNYASRLECFYNGIFALELPSLTSLNLNGCKLDSFSYGSVSTPQLTQVQIDNKDCPHSGNLNEDIKNEITVKKYTKVNVESTEGFAEICRATQYLCFTKYLKISCCHRLLHAIPYKMLGSLQKLEELVVESCHSVEEIFEFEGVSVEETSGIVLPNLEKITLRWLEKLKCVINKIPRGIVSFSMLRKLVVDSCYNLKNIFTISVARELTQLEVLSIFRCNGVEQILVGEEEEENTEKVIFPRLRCIDFSFIGEVSSRLKCFYSGVHSLEFPLLESLGLDECYRMTTFSTSPVSTPLLQQVRLNWNYYPFTGDLNRDIKNKMLDVVIARTDEDMMRICQIAEEGSIGIRDLSISHSEKPFSAVPYSVIQNLEKLCVEKCHSMEAIFELDKRTSFSTLQNIELYDLENLKRIFNKMPTGFVGFQQLTLMEVKSCLRLENVFTVSVVRGLQQLQCLNIYDCAVEQIIAEDEESNTGKIVLPKLESISVSYSENLKCFYNGTCDIELPLLQRFAICDCMGVETFSNGSVTTPKLQTFEIDSEKYPCSGNLNADIMKPDGHYVMRYLYGIFHELRESTNLSREFAKNTLLFQISNKEMAQVIDIFKSEMIGVAGRQLVCRSFGLNDTNQADLE